VLSSFYLVALGEAKIVSKLAKVTRVIHQKLSHFHFFVPLMETIMVSELAESFI
jgi:hypothetical protein